MVVLEEHILPPLVDAYVLMAILDEHIQDFFFPSPIRQACDTFLRAITLCVLTSISSMLFVVRLTSWKPQNVQWQVNSIVCLNSHVSFL